ncbi:MAG: thioredoxin domain-containing protein [Acidobacteria bacterium]|nr:thioredoxin domain-containing protein [Acidobacteriota bacterium]MBV9067879.1 thioredoxin domain-containing protein [Acidobacteriota bacterium]MBV9186766.1 thioredoxin domain-containing protein [Acidobacteriota bacterium]
MAQLVQPVTEEDHIAGPVNAPLTLVEYGDFECPHCGAAHPVVKEIQQLLGDTLRFVFRQFPLTQIHPHAEHAAEASESAAAQDAFWEMHDIIFENQTALADRDLLRYAAAIDIDAEQVAEDLAAGTWQTRVRRDFASGVRSGVNGTPTFFINGMRYDGLLDARSLLAALRVSGGRASR